MRLHRLFAGLAASLGPELVRQQCELAREREEAERKQREDEERRIEAALAEVARVAKLKFDFAAMEEARLLALEDQYAKEIAPCWRPEVFRSTKGYIDAWGKPASQDMIDLHERLKARDSRNC